MVSSQMTSKYKTFRLNDIVYDVNILSELGLTQLSLLEFATVRIGELSDHLALLHRAKISYVDTLKKEIISNKTGFLFDET